jgi:DNA-binding FrmR family transcriptional regulator
MFGSLLLVIADQIRLYPTGYGNIKRHITYGGYMADSNENLEVSQEVLLKRLKRLEGQIRGIQKMVVENRDCVSLVIQLAAVRSGIEGIGALVLNNCMKICFHKGPEASSDLDSLEKAVAIWGRVRSGEDK